jgi:hypothetical protein
MKLETALTAFCMTTVLLIVGLVVLTASQQRLLDPSIVGNYYFGIPLQGRVSREQVPLVLVDVDPNDPLCYQHGVGDCKRANAGENFVLCTDRVALDCGMPHARLALCVLTAGFELKYVSKRECQYGVIDECKARCAAGLVEECVERSKGRCELIGGRFQELREEERRAAYPSRQLSILTYRP